MHFTDSYATAQHFNLEREEQSDEGWLACLGTEVFQTLQDESTHWLHPEEAEYYHSVLAEKRRKSFLIGRVCAKIAYQAASKSQNAALINIRTGIFKDPVLQNLTSIQWQVGITHSNNMAGALIFPATHPMALDIEEMDPKRVSVMKTQCKTKELHYLQELGLSDKISSAVCWTAKEALSKALKTGMTCPFELMEINSIHHHKDGGLSGLLSNFHQYQFRSWIIENHVLSIALPKRTRLIFRDDGPNLPKLTS